MTSKTETGWLETATKPLSVNEAWLGQKIKSGKYRAYENHLLMSLPNDLILPSTHALKLSVCVFYSSPLSDVDNCLKPFIDVLQKKYGFNDNRIFEIRIKKFLVKKGEENILFNIEAIEDSKWIEKLDESSLLVLKAKYLTR